MTRHFTILTEETPNIDEVKLMLSMIGVYIAASISNDSIIPDINSDTEGKKEFKGVWRLKVDDLIITIKLFKGETSSVDYLLFNGDVDLTTGNAGEALVVLESTKTSDGGNGSRNTAVMQRISKFIVFKKMYPKSNAKLIMFYLESNWQENLTNTAILGFKMMTLLDIELYSVLNKKFIDLKLKYNITPFRTDDELISFKNNIEDKSNNLSIRITKENNVYKITGKLDKGSEDSNSYGKLNNDPNKGMLGAIMNCLEKLNPGSKMILTTHGLHEDSLKRCKDNNKFFILVYGINFEFYGITFTKTIKIADKYFTIESKMTEKLATILYDYVSPNKTIFSNHGGCALTCIKGLGDSTCSVGRKMGRPDIVFRNDRLKELEIIEGKLEKEINKGIKQLSDVHLEGFMGLLNKLYPDYTIKKGLCITISSIDCIDKYKDIEFPIKFALDNKGFFIQL